MMMRNEERACGTDLGGRPGSPLPAGMMGRLFGRGSVLLAVAGLACGTTFAQGAGVAVEPDGGSETLPQQDGGETELDLSDISALMRAAGAGNAPAAAPRGDFPAWSEASKGFTKVVSAADGGSLYDVWVNRKTNEMLAELPRGFERQRHFFAMTVAGGDLFAGLQAGELYAYWKRYDKRLALIQPNVEVRSTGDQESRDSVSNIWTDRVLLDIPIVCMGPSGQPVINMNDLLVGQAREFFGGQASGLNSRLARISEAKSFPENAELAFEVPDRSGLLKTFHYSISLIKNTPGFRPREADTRVGYFTTAYRDLGKFTRDETVTRYINRWHIEKADPKRRMSPPKEPLVFYVEHTVPVRYRRWVREGIEYWNEAYENIGIVGAIEVRYQDKASGAHMDKDPEDVRYNFIRWLSNDIGTAIGPSRVNPNTGEILDADVVLTDGWIRAFEYQWSDVMPNLATEGFSPDLMNWLDKNPSWDPRLRLVSSAERDEILTQRVRRGVQAYGGHPAANVTSTMLGENEYSGLANRVSQKNGLCMAAQGRALDLASFRMHMDVLRMTMTTDGSLINEEGEAAASQPAGIPDDIPPEMIEMLKQQLAENPELINLLPPELRKLVEATLKAEAEPEADDEPAADEPATPKMPDKPKSDMVDGMPEEFIGPALAELVAHEVGHTLGLRHNFKGSSVYTFDEINSDELRGEKPWSTTVMDYCPINIRMPGYGSAQGDWAVINIGPYDMWAIEYGYGFGDPKKVLERVAEPELQYGTDEDTWGPDPYARRYDMGKDPLTYAQNQMELIRVHREKLLTDFVADGESWSEARRGYQMTLGLQTRAVSMMSNWLGGAHVYRDKKGDPNGRSPIEVVGADTQRDALAFVIENTFYDKAFGVNSELLQHMTVDKWWDSTSMGSIFQDPTFPIHDRIMGIQASGLTMVMNPYTLQRVLDNEVFVPAEADALTLPEVLDSVTDAIWTEVMEGPTNGRFTARNPMVSSLRRNLQQEHLERLIDLTMPTETMNTSYKPIANLATSHLRRLHSTIGQRLESPHQEPDRSVHTGAPRRGAPEDRASSRGRLHLQPAEHGHVGAGWLAAVPRGRAGEEPRRLISDRRARASGRMLSGRALRLNRLLVGINQARAGEIPGPRCFLSAQAMMSSGPGRRCITRWYRRLGFYPAQGAISRWCIVIGRMGVFACGAIDVG
jgi:hypothetical protein